jgi:hypothetical protein
VKDGFKASANLVLANLGTACADWAPSCFGDTAGIAGSRLAGAQGRALTWRSTRPAPPPADAFSVAEALAPVSR